MADELETYLQSLPDKLTEKLSDLLRDQAERLSAAQKQELRALEQPPEETGALEASLVVVPGDNPLEFFVQGGGEVTTKDGNDHALNFEFGTSKQPARPFFYSTWNALRDDMQEKIQDAIDEVLSND
jgi:HK97 gp10 family phage protein